MNVKLVIFAVFIAFAMVEALRGGFFRQKDAVKGDAAVDFLSTIVLLGLVQPAIIFAVMSA